MSTPSYFQYSQEQLQALRAADAQMSKLIALVGQIKREVLPDFYKAAVFTIIGQQISSKAQENIWERLSQLLASHTNPQDKLANAITPTLFLQCSATELRQCGMSPQKVHAIQALSTAILEGKLVADDLPLMTDAQVIEALTALPGIGLWTAQMLLIFCFQRMDVLSYNDFGIREGICQLYHLNGITKAQFKTYQERFSPYGTLASFYLWELANGHVTLP